MEKFYSIYFDLFKSLHQQMKEALNGVSQGGLDFCPGTEMNSMAVLAAQTAGVNAADLTAHLNETLEIVREVLEGLTLQDLHSTRISPRDGSQKEVSWCLLHALEHFGVHTGHVQITRQLWDQQNS
ncbi:MAG: DUF664 domain-containing protein [Anaerolineaceae bacterium]